MESQEVAFTMDLPPSVGNGPRLNRASIGGTPDSPRLPFLKLLTWMPPHVQFDGSFPSISSNSATPSLKDFRRISLRVSVMFVVEISSHQRLSGLILRI